MNILITNDDGYNAKGIHVLAEIMCQFGNVTVIAPKYHQSGMSMAVSLGLRQVAYKDLPEEKPGKWSYLDATPASCVKFGLNVPFLRMTRHLDFRNNGDATLGSIFHQVAEFILGIVTTLGTLAALLLHRFLSFYHLIL